MIFLELPLLITNLFYIPELKALYARSEKTSGTSDKNLEKLTVKHIKTVPWFSSINLAKNVGSSKTTIDRIKKK